MMKYYKRMMTRLIFLGILSISHITALAQEIKIGMKMPVDLLNTPAAQRNASVLDHIYDPLICIGSAGDIVPCLAESWKNIDPVTWELKLRKGVKFHNGQEFTAEDAVWSLNRVTGGYEEGNGIKAKKDARVGNFVVDKYTIRLGLEEPTPNLLSQLSFIKMKSKQVEMSGGSDNMGTGPFRFVKQIKNDTVLLERNEQYWRINPSEWKKVSFVFIPDLQARLKALQEGQLQAIEDVSTQDVERLRSNPNFNVISKASGRFIFLVLDVDRSRSPFVFDKNDVVLEKNPLKDAKVRRAIFLAINRVLIRDQIMKGLSEPTHNFVKAGSMAFNDNYKSLRYDVKEAKKLLSEAGYKEGFKMTLHSANGLYLNDAKIMSAVAEMLGEIGITAKAESMRPDDFIRRGELRQFSIGLVGWNTMDADALSPITGFATCDLGTSNYNWARYCNQKVDALVQKAMKARSEKEHMAALKEAYGMVIADAAYIPIHQQMNTWVVHKKLRFTTRSDDRTHAYDFTTR